MVSGKQHWVTEGEGTIKRADINSLCALPTRAPRNAAFKIKINQLRNFLNYDFPSDLYSVTQKKNKEHCEEERDGKREGGKREIPNFL